MAGVLTKPEPTTARPWFRRGPLASLREELDDVVSNFLGDDLREWPTSFGRLATSLDLSETDAGIEVRVDLPGVKPEEIDIQLSGNLLTISGERKEEKEKKGKTYHRVERRSGSFSRSVTLPCPVNEDKIDAQYKDGVLTITVPKTEEAKAKKIKVKA